MVWATEFVLARLQFVVGERSGQIVLADVAGRHRDLRLAPVVLPLPGARGELGEVGPEVRRVRHDGREVGAGQGEQRARGLGGGGLRPPGVVVQQGVLAEAVAVRQDVQGDLVAVAAGGGLADPAVRDQMELVRGRAPLDQRLPRPEITLDAPVGDGRQHLGVVEVPQQGQFAQLLGDDPDRGPVLDELHPPVAHGEGEPPVDPVGAALGLDPGKHPQQPTGGDLLHLRGGLRRAGEVAGGGRPQAGLAGHFQPRFRARVNSHRAGSPWSERERA